MASWWRGPGRATLPRLASWWIGIDPRCIGRRERRSAPTQTRGRGAGRLLAAFRRLGSFRGEASFKTWLLTIAWHQAINRRRSVIRILRRMVEPRVNDEGAPMMAEFVAAGPTPEESAAQGEWRGAIRDAITALRRSCAMRCCWRSRATTATTRLPRCSARRRNNQMARVGSAADCETAAPRTRARERARVTEAFTQGRRE